MSKSIRAKIIGPFMLALGIFGLYSGFEQNAVAARIQKEGVSVPAQVMDQHVRSGRRGSRTYLVTVDFQPKGGAGSIQKEFSVSKSVYEAVSPGSSLNVRHLPSDPATAEIEGDADTGKGGFLFGGIMLAAGGLISFLAYRKTEPTPTP